MKHWITKEKISVFKISFFEKISSGIKKIINPAEKNFKKIEICKKKFSDDFKKNEVKNTEMVNKKNKSSNFFSCILCFHFTRLIQYDNEKKCKKLLFWIFTHLSFWALAKNPFCKL